MLKRTYLDSGLIIRAFQGTPGVYEKAMEIIDDPGRTFVVSDAIWLELFPKAIRNKKTDEIEFYSEIFGNAEVLSWDINVLNDASKLAGEHGLGAMDAIHVSHCLATNIDELATTEKPSKPMCNIPNLKTISVI